MFSQGDEGQQGLVLTVVLGLVGFVVALVLMLAIDTSLGVRPPAAARTVTLPSAPVPVPVMAAPPAGATSAPSLSVAQTALANQAREDAASVKVEREVVKFYFASGQADLAAGAADALTGLVRVAGKSRKFVVSGFHDASGDPVRNAELARRRALSVRDALTRLGVREQQIELRKPESVAAAGTDPEARRVEITLQ